MTQTMTLIISTLNHESFIERTLCSVLDQQAPEVQIIVVDRGSTDQTLEQINLYQNQIDQIIQAPGSTLGTALNRAMTYAQGTWISILPGDALLMPQAIETVRNAIKPFPQATWFVGSNLRIDTHDKIRGTIHPSLPQSLACYLMRDGGLVPPTGVFYQLQVLHDVGGYNPDLEESCDYDLWCRFFAAGDMPQILHQTLATTRQPSRPDLQHMLSLGEQYLHIARQYAEHLPRIQRYALWHNCDRRQRIFALIRAEMQGQQGSDYLVNQLMNHPWWASDRHFQKALEETLKKSHPHASSKHAA